MTTAGVTGVVVLVVVVLVLVLVLVEVDVDVLVEVEVLVVGSVGSERAASPPALASEDVVVSATRG